MRIMVYNILDGGTGRIDPIAEVIRAVDPDCVVVPEAVDAGDRAEFEKLAQRLGMDHFIAQSSRNANDAVGLLSRLKIVEATNLSPLDDRFTRAALRAVVREGGRDFGIIGVHLHSGERLTDEAIRVAEIPAVLAAAQDWRSAGFPHVLAGDFNATSPQQIVDVPKLREKTRERIRDQNNIVSREAIRSVLTRGYVDSHAIGRTPAEFGCSFTTSHPALRVDYVFVPPELEAGVQRSEVVTHPLGKFASDHYPIVCEISMI